MRDVKKIAISTIIFFVLSIVIGGIGQKIFGGREPYKTPQEREIEELHKRLDEGEGHMMRLSLENENLLEIIQEASVTEEQRKNQDKIIIDVINANVKGKLSGKGEIYFIASQFYNVNPLLMVAISIHETANGTSEMILNKNNVGGFYYKGFLNFRTIDESIFYMARLLKTEYIDNGLTNIDLIGSKYCPIGASNDPTGLNKHWVPRVTEIYLDLYNQAGGAI